MFYLHNGYVDDVFHYNGCDASDGDGAQLWKNRDYYNEFGSVFEKLESIFQVRSGF